MYLEDAHFSPMAQGMQGGSSRSTGVMSCRQWSWKVWLQGRTATAGGMGGCTKGPSGANDKSLLHSMQLNPVVGGISKPASQNHC